MMNNIEIPLSLLSDISLSPTDKLILIAINHLKYNEYDGFFIVKLNEVMKLVSISNRTIRRTISKLTDEDFFNSNESKSKGAIRKLYPKQKFYETMSLEPIV